METTETQETPGKLVAFLIGQTGRDLEATDVVDVKAMRSAPSYPDVIPKQKIIRLEKRECDGVEVEFLVKAYLPDAVVVEASRATDDLWADSILDSKRSLIAACRTILHDFGCHPDYDEEYTVYCISGYRGDPEAYVSRYGEKIAALLKNERTLLDEEEVEMTLASCLKYGKDDLTIVDWDGAFIFDSAGEFQSNIELFEIANLQLLKARILDHDLDARLERTLQIVQTTRRRIPLINSREVTRALREIVQLRTQSLLESVERDIKLIGDWYSAKLYSLIARKFHLEEWKANIEKKLETLEDAYTMATENFTVSYRQRLEFLLLGGWFVLLLFYVLEFFFLK